MPVAKTITYENLPEENKKDPKILPFKYIKPFKQEVEEIEKEAKQREWYEAIPEEEKGPWDEPQKPWYENGKTKAPKVLEGIMRVASSRGDREYLIMMLSRYYSPRDLYYKTIPELNDMLNLHLTESGGLI